jgi:HD-like signal output (HDOD) protein
LLLLSLAHSVDAVGGGELSAEHAAIASRLSKLPHFQTSALNLLNLATDSEAAIQDIENVFLSDPALATDLLLIANSVEFGFRARVETVRHALTLLGLDRVRALASTVAMQLYVRKVQRKTDLGGVWAHSIATAVIAESVGNLYGSPGMYTAGLTHDLGRLGLRLAGGDKYVEYMSMEFTDLAEAYVVEKTLFGMDHCEAGAFLAQTWGFPESLRTHMASHHESSEGGLTDPRYLIQLACRLADSLNFVEVQRLDLASAPALPERLRRRSELAPERLQEQIERRMSALGPPETGGATSPSAPGRPRLVRPGPSICR